MKTPFIGRSIDQLGESGGAVVVRGQAMTILGRSRLRQYLSRNDLGHRFIAGI